MQALIEVILPVFLVIGFGYLAAWKDILSEAGVDGIVKFTQSFAIPCLLFSAIARLDLTQDFDLRVLGSFYIGAVSGFVTGLLGARYLFDRAWPDSVAIGFCCLFSNSVLLGLVITERAYGPDALTANYAIVAIHAPFCYIIGLSVMEFVRARGGGAGETLRKIVTAVFRNALVIGIGLGFFVNLAGLSLPAALQDGVDLMVQAALPAALFGLGGVLVRYRPEGDLRTIAFVCAVSLVLHPAVTWGLAQAFDLSRDQMRSAVVTASMAPGINTYLFANIYGVAKRVAASGVLIGTALSVVTTSLWLSILP
ncbi:MAG: AEC family transporter [Rhodobacteraceae bacterium]|nr:AEC family transporter [Paracoccaceae bacterium]